MNRREFLFSSAVAAIPEWKPGSVAHLLPTVSWNRLVLKASLTEPQAKPPRLALDHARPVRGIQGDSKGLFWSFDIANLEPARRYTLHLLQSSGRQLCDPWPLTMMPTPEETPKRLRLAIYTCAGGHEAIHDQQGRGAFLSLQIRRRFLKRMLSFQPDAVIAIGDHVYWDQRSVIGMGGGNLRSQQQIRIAGEFNRSAPILGTSNEQSLLKAVDPQIASLYGTLFRSTPVFFVQDDHDYFDNDEATDALVTLPPDAFMLNAARATRNLYYPSFLPDPTRPDGLGGSTARDSECFGTLRYGKLAELLIYDCRRYLSLAGPSAGFIPETAEQWLHARTKANDTRHLVHIPSVPFGWSAGKWGEWYADVLDARGNLTINKPKPYWQSGWRFQHDRILQTLCGNRQRTPLLISGDLHSLAMGRIHRSGSLDLSANPVTVMVAGPISTGATGWPSQARNTLAQTAIGLEMETKVPVVEHNGFTIATITDSEVSLQLFGWKSGMPEEAIDNLEALR